MAKEKVNKSAMVREILERDPKTPVKEIVKTITDQGVKIAPSMVYYIKSMMKRAKRRQVRQQVAKSTGNANTVALVRRVKDIAHEVGGMQKLRELVEILAQ
jgi:hypothetical protein